MTDEERCYAADFPLHARAIAYTSGEVIDDDDWLGQFKSLIQAGCDANQTCSRGMTIWQQLEPAPGASFERLGDATTLLVKAGFNPLLQMLGKTFKEPCGYLAYGFIGAEAGGAEEARGLGAIRGLIAREATEPMRSESGGNLLHALALETPEALIEIFDHFTPYPNDHSGRFQLPEIWINALDDDNRTPLALLWDHQGKAAHLQHETDPGEIEIALMGIWSATEALMEAGASLLNKDAQGRPLWQAMTEHLGQFPEHRSSMPAIVAARLGEICLEANTPTIKSGGRGGPRL